jgi:gluconolactonase
LTLPDQIDVVSKLQFAPDGLALDANGQLVLAGYAGRSIDRLANEGLQALANAYQGQALNSPDDLEVRTDGTIYFTDPTFGLNGTRGALGFQGVYRISPDGALSLEDKSKSDGPNGASLSPDESVLYVSFTNTGKVAKYAVHADGSLGARTAFASGVTMADSMCVDSGGNVYVASASGLAVLDATGKRLGTIPTSNQVPSNCAFGGPDQRTLFITARTALMSIANMPIPGIPGRS